MEILNIRAHCLSSKWSGHAPYQASKTAGNIGAQEERMKSYHETAQTALVNEESDRGGLSNIF